MIESRSNCFYIALGNPQANPPVIVPQVALFPESYEFPSANQFVRQSGTQVALANADSYALLDVALLLSTCDWRDGYAGRLASTQIRDRNNLK